MNFPTLVRELSLSLVPFILSLTVHEFAHAYIATRLGDGTARERGRLTLNPVAHIDPWGTLLLPTLGVVLGGFNFIAWAKPVPYDPSRFRQGVNRRVGSALVAAAGPLSNVLLALIACALLAGFQRADIGIWTASDATGETIVRPTPWGLLLVAMFQRNIALAVFNLLPFPPLDGHYLLPPALDPIVRPLSRYGLGILMLVCMFQPGLLSAVMDPPMRWLSHGMMRLFGVA
jgi:Zn-dependent protease